MIAKEQIQKNENRTKKGNEKRNPHKVHSRKGKHSKQACHKEIDHVHEARGHSPHKNAVTPQAQRLQQVNPWHRGMKTNQCTQKMREDKHAQAKTNVSQAQAPQRLYTLQPFNANLNRIIGKRKAYCRRQHV